MVYDVLSLIDYDKPEPICVYNGCCELGVLTVLGKIKLMKTKSG